MSSAKGVVTAGPSTSRGGAHPASLADPVGHIPLSWRPPCPGGRLVRAPALVLMPDGIMSLIVIEAKQLPQMGAEHERVDRRPQGRRRRCPLACPSTAQRGR